MSVKIVQKKLRHSFPISDIRDPQLRDVVMKLGENMKLLEEQLHTLQNAVIELQLGGR